MLQVQINLRKSQGGLRQLKVFVRKKRMLKSTAEIIECMCKMTRAKIRDLRLVGQAPPLLDKVPQPG
jgi:hypothetical protein